ncbi:MAG TPA: DNA-processing protein DprA [Opitutaceae bacterium]
MARDELSMSYALSRNTQAILLLTAPLLGSNGEPSSASPLSPVEYKRLARMLREQQHEPADFLSTTANAVIEKCARVVDAARLGRLLDRGLLLSLALERWQTRAIWVISRADPEYPRRLKARLRENSPPVLYGCGQIDWLDSGGLAVVGSRNANDSLLEYSMRVGSAAASAGYPVVSGGARGVDSAAMHGALVSRGRVIGVLPDSLERAALAREYRNALIAGQLLLVSPYDPAAGFNAGHALSRNKLIYALADAGLVAETAHGEGGTWAGAVEQIDKLRFVPIYVRSTGEIGKGLEALRAKGALPWPNPDSAESFAATLAARISPQPRAAIQKSLFPQSAGSLENDATK